MSFGDAINSGFSNYANFKGRATRTEYWYWSLFNFLALFPVFLFDSSGVLYNIAWLGLLLPGLAVAVRRMHDVGRSGWWIVVPIVDLVFALQPSQPLYDTESAFGVQSPYTGA